MIKSWLCDNKECDNDVNCLPLILKTWHFQIERSDFGEYTCRASNEVTTVNVNVMAFVIVIIINAILIYVMIVKSSLPWSFLSSWSSSHLQIGSSADKSVKLSGHAMPATFKSAQSGRWFVLINIMICHMKILFFNSLFVICHDQYLMLPERSQFSNPEF